MDFFSPESAHIITGLVLIVVSLFIAGLGKH
jgi:hypothetical protein